ncbi:MAG: hypothetical protein QOI81_2291 [Actinomycetota bacterium]|nr:hypothetical protein [Actinomycetota bacterium]
MPRVSPFEGLTYLDAAGPLDQVTAPPYDVISDDHRRAYQEASPYSVVHLDLAEGSRDPADPGNRYDRAAGLLERWQSEGALARAPSPQYYAYEMAFELDGAAGAIRGLFVALELEPWGIGVIPHERTMAGPVEDRLRLLRATRTHLSAVYGAIAGPNAQLATLLRDVTAGHPSHRTRDGQGVEHRMWSVPAEDRIAEWFADTPILIADGHHRYTTALQYRDEVHAVRGAGPWDQVLALVVDATAEHLPVLPFHRIQTAGAPSSPAVGTTVDGASEALDAISDDPPSVALVVPGPVGPRFEVIALGGAPPAVRALHEGPLREVSDADLRFTPDAAQAVGAVASGEAVAAWLLPPTTPDRIREVIERGERLPQKSTYFWPKPRTGMVMMPLDAATTPPAAPSS